MIKHLATKRVRETRKTNRRHKNKFFWGGGGEGGGLEKKRGRERKRPIEEFQGKRKGDRDGWEKELERAKLSLSLSLSSRKLSNLISMPQRRTTLFSDNKIAETFFERYDSFSKQYDSQISPPSLFRGPRCVRSVPPPRQEAPSNDLTFHHAFLS